MVVAITQASDPSIPFHKYLVHNAMDGYMGAHGYDNQEVAAATG